MPRLDRYFCAHMTRTPTRYGALYLLLALLISGCTINRDIMFKTPRDYQFAEFTDTIRTNLKLQANDALQFRLFANDGFKMIDLVSEGGTREASFIQRSVFTYNIDNSGLVKLPVIGRVKLAGLTLREAETFLEDQFTKYYNRPFVQLMVNNRRVVVFPGGGGDAKTIPLENNNTTLLEVIGQAGGLSSRGNAHKVKVFRLNGNEPRLVYQFDLSDIEGLKYADMVMQGDDVVYVQPNADLAREAIQDLAPIITLLSSVLLVIAVGRNLQ